MLAKPEADRKKAVLLTARAMDVLEGDPRQAAADAQAALKLAPGLVPAAITAAKALFRLNDLRRGSKILETVWKANPHPDVADTYVRARAGDSVQDRLKRAHKLEALKPNHAESLRIVASAALDAHEHKTARDKAEAALRQQPREGLYLLLADIEEADTGDEGRVRHWMSQAVKAPRDPAWTADGYVAREWAPVSPVTGEIDAFVWKVPVKELHAPEIEGGAVQSSANDPDEAIRSLPPVKAPEPAASERRDDEHSIRRPIEIDSESVKTAETAKVASASAESPARAAEPDLTRPDLSRNVPPAPVVAPAPAPVAVGSERTTAAVEVPPASASAAAVGSTPAKAGNGAVIIPLQSQSQPKPTAEPAKSDDAGRAEVSQAAERPVESSKPKWYQKPPLVIEPGERARTTDAIPEDDRRADPASHEHPATLKDGQQQLRQDSGNLVSGDQRHAERSAEKSRHASATPTAFRGQPVDDPGVDEQAEDNFTARSSSRFRLF
jgi:HemY protein